jgi:phage shock protein A
LRRKKEAVTVTNDDDAQSSLGEKLLAAVQSLWGAVNGHSGSIAELRQRMDRLETQVHGLKVSRGRARAKNSRLEVALTEAESKLSDIRVRLN